jgi:hypothetical protein
MPSVELIWDRIQIVELSARFNHAIDDLTMDIQDSERHTATEGLLSTFEPEGILAVEGGVAFEGHERLRAMCSSHASGELVPLGRGRTSAISRSIHTSSDHVVDISGDTATMSSYLVRYLQIPISGPAPHGLFIVTQMFSDELRRTTDGEAGWRFVRRLIRSVHANADLDTIWHEMPSHFQK